MTSNQSQPATFLDNGRLPISMVGVRPIGNNILCEKLPEMEQSHGGLFLIPNDKSDTARYRVISCGSGWRTRKGILVAFDCKPGDVIIGEGRVPDTMRLDGTKLKLLKNHEVIAVEVP